MRPCATRESFVMALDSMGPISVPPETQTYLEGRSAIFNALWIMNEAFVN